MAENTEYRVVRNLKHSGQRFVAGQVVAGFDDATAERLLANGSIKEFVVEQPAEVLDANTKKPLATTVQQQGAPAPVDPAASQQPGTVVSQPGQPGAAGGRQLTPEEQAVANAAAEVE